MVISHEILTISSYDGASPTRPGTSRPYGAPRGVGVIDAREGPLVDRFHFHDNFGKAVKIWDTTGLDWMIRCVIDRGEIYLLPFSGGILVPRDGKDYRFEALRPGGISIMLGAILNGFASGDISRSEAILRALAAGIEGPQGGMAYIRKE